VLAWAGVGPAVVLVGWLAATYPLVIVGASDRLPALLAALPVIALLLLLVARGLPEVPGASWASVGATLAVAAGFGGLAAATHAQHVVVRRDPGVYALAAQWLAEHGSLVIPAQLEAAGGANATMTAASPGFYTAGDGLVPQFMSGAAMAYQPAGWLAGVDGVLVAPAIYTALALLAFGGLTARLVGARWAPVAALALGLCLPLLLAGRTTLSEPLALLLIAGGLCLVLDATATGGRIGWWLAGLAGLGLGLGVLVRIDAVREVLLLVPVVGWLALRRRREWLPLAAGAVVGAGYAAVDGVVQAEPYVRDLTQHLRPLLAGGAVLAVATAAGVLAVRVLRRRMAAGGRWDRVRAASAWIGAGVVVVAAAYLAARPWLGAASQPHGQLGDAYIAGLQQAQGLPVDGSRSYAEQTLRWTSWYVGWPAVALAGAAAAVLVWRALRGGRGTRADRWMLVLPVLLGSTALTLYRPSITPDHPWADRRLVPTVLPTVVLLAVCALAAVGSAELVRRRSGGRRVAIMVAAAASAVLVVPAVAGSAPLAFARTEVGEPAAVERACAAFGPGDVALLVDARARQEWTATLRQLCGLPTFAVPRSPGDDPADPVDVGTVVDRVRAAGGRPILVAPAADPLRRFTGAPPRRIVLLNASEHARPLEHRPTGLTGLRLELWLAPAG
jgi:hypothetical protein